MATRRYSIAAGERSVNITEAVGAATATKSMEFTADLTALAAAGATRQDVLLALEDIVRYIHEHNWPPA